MDMIRGSKFKIALINAEATRATPKLEAEDFVDQILKKEDHEDDTQATF